MKVIFALCSLCFALQGFAQLTPASLQEIPRNQLQTGPRFVYRIQSGAELHFYHIEILQEVYNSHNAYFWPPSIPHAQRYVSRLVGSEEVILNDSLILSPAKNLFLQSDTGLIALRRLPELPGLLWMEGPENSVFQSVGLNDLGPTRPLPHQFYSYSDRAQPIWVRKEGFRSQEFDTRLPRGQIGSQKVSLSPLPKVPLLPYFYSDNLEQAPVTQASLDALDAKIAEIEQDLLRDSLRISTIIDSLRNDYPPPLPQLDGESDNDYQARLRVHGVEAIAFAAQVRSHNRYAAGLIAQRERILRLQNRRDLIAQDLRVGRSWQAEVLWNRFYVVASGVLKRYLPDWAYGDESSTPLGGGGRIEYRWPALGRTSLVVHGMGAYSAWEHSERRHGREIQAGAGLGWELPLFTSTRFNFSLQANVGGQWLYRNTEVSGGELRRLWDAGSTVGGVAGVSLYLTRIPIVLGGNFRYGADRYGDVEAHIGFALPWVLGGE